MKFSGMKSKVTVPLQQAGFIQAALLFGIALMTAVLGGFALANRSPTSQTDVEQAKVNASVILKQASDLRDGVARYSSDFGSSSITASSLGMDFTSNTGNGTTTATGLFDPVSRYASPQIMPESTFASGEDRSIKTPSAFAAGHWYFNKVTPGNTLATNSADPMVVLPGLRADVCQRVNILLYGPSAPIPVATGNLADWVGNANGGISASTGMAGWPEGCVKTADATDKYVYFKAVQEN